MFLPGLKLMQKPIAKWFFKFIFNDLIFNGHIILFYLLLFQYNKIFLITILIPSNLLEEIKTLNCLK